LWGKNNFNLGPLVRREILTTTATSFYFLVSKIQIKLYLIILLALFEFLRQFFKNPQLQDNSIYENAINVNNFPFVGVK